MKKYILLLLSIAAFGQNPAPQPNGIRTDRIEGYSNNPLNINNKGGVIPTKVTTTQRDAIPSPQLGAIVTNTTNNRLEYYDGFNWVAFGGDYIPLSGTVEGSPVTGDIEFEDGYASFSIFQKNSFEDYLGRLSFGEGISLKASNGSETANSSSITVTKDKIVADSFSGIEYQIDNRANYTERSLVDKQYVDDAIAGGGGSGVASITAGSNINLTGTPTDPTINLNNNITLGSLGVSGNGTFGGNVSGTWTGVAVGTNYGGTGLVGLGLAGQSYRVKADLSGLEWYTPAASIGTVTSVTGTGGITVANGTTTPVIGVGNLTPTSVAASGTVTGTNVDATNKTDIAGKEPAITAGTSTQIWQGNKLFVEKSSLPISTATQNALDLKANLASPALTGTPTAPTAAPGVNTTQVATTAYSLAAANAKVTDAIVDNVTTVAPSQNAVYDELQMYSKSIARSSSSGTMTSGTTEQIVQVITIPANSTKADNFLSVFVPMTKTGNASAATIRMRLSTTTTGGNQIATFTMAATTGLQVNFARTFLVQTGNLLNGFPPTQNAASDESVVSSVNRFTEVYDPTVTNYIIVTAQPGTTDTINTVGYLVTRK